MIRALAIALLLAIAAAGWQTIRLSRAQTTIANMAARSVAEQFATSEAYRKEEQTRARYIAGVGEAYERGKARVQAELDGVLDDVRAGRYELRQSLRCPAGAAAATPASAGQRDAASASPGGVSQADVQFLVRFAGDADAVSEQLRACQSIVRADRQVIP